MHSRLELAVGLPLEVLSDIADESAGFGRRINPDTVFVEYLESRD